MYKVQMTTDLSLKEVYDKCKQAMSYCKEMVKLAKDQGAHKVFILGGPMEKGFLHGLQGYFNAKRWRDNEKMTFFKEECRKFAFNQELIAKMVCGENLHFYDRRDAYRNFDNYVENLDIRSNGFVICCHKKGQKKRR